MENRPTTATEPQAQTDQRQATLDHLARLQERAIRGDQTVLPELRQALDDNPHVWSSFGDLADHALASWILAAGGSNLLLGESINRKTAAMKDELAGPSSSPLEKLLASRVVISWVEVSYYSTVLAQAGGSNEPRRKMLQHHYDAANRRHLAAVKMLGTIKKLLAPSRSPIQIASRMGQPNPAVQRGRAGAGAVKADSGKPDLQLVQN